MDSSSDTSDLDPEDDGLDDPVWNKEVEDVFVYDTLDDGSKVLSKEKSYKMAPVEERVGVRINPNNHYYNQKAIDFYNQTHNVLIKHS